MAASVPVLWCRRYRAARAFRGVSRTDPHHNRLLAGQNRDQPLVARCEQNNSGIKNDSTIIQDPGCFLYIKRNRRSNNFSLPRCRRIKMQFGRTKLKLTVFLAAIFRVTHERVSDR